ncbi:MAG TPA: menaquinone biosynthesis protein [Ferruginibacter sp.]|nr:menaquinone biosynthesis protein [Ferruginibacter sp.]
MDRKIRVGAVSYLNTKPLIYGFEQGMMKDKVELIIDYPAKIAAALLNDEIDIGLIPVAIIPEMKEYHIIGNHCISSEGEVASVCLFSEVPLDEIETVLLDYQSRTSVMLAQVLMKEFWKIDPIIQKADKNFQSMIKDTTAAIVIGDRALEQRKISAYQYDLGLAWKEYTGLPFVFAAWVSNKILPTDFIINFDKANAIGLANLDKVIEQNPFSTYDLLTYYTDNIKFTLRDDKRKAIDLFLEKLNS